jgi:hypothetical protein
MTSFRFSMLLVLAALPACSALVHPDPSRLGEGDGGGSSLDAPSREDVPLAQPDVPEGSDVPVVQPDVPGGPTCEIACEGGTVCIDGACVCPDGACCPGCHDDELCVVGTCLRCGHETESCCSEARCLEDGLACVEDRCARCGELFGPCCAGGGCHDGASCIGGTCLRDDCGDSGERCCEGAGCLPGLACVDPFPIGEPRCRACGDRTEPCCDGECNGERLVCNGGSCETCGGNTQACCGGGVCGAGLDCDMFSMRCF